METARREEEVMVTKELLEHVWWWWWVLCIHLSRALVLTDFVTLLAVVFHGGHAENWLLHLVTIQSKVEDGLVNFFLLCVYSMILIHVILTRQ